jgi:hypothetical protein
LVLWRPFAPGELSTRLLAVHFDKGKEAEAVVRQLADVRGAEFNPVHR